MTDKALFDAVNDTEDFGISGPGPLTVQLYDAIAAKQRAERQARLLAKWLAEVYDSEFGHHHNKGDERFDPAYWLRRAAEEVGEEPTNWDEWVKYRDYMPEQEEVK